ncbi:MAG: hypothetical protein ACRDQ5_13940, partial [Sciscionella sp.]
PTPALTSDNAAHRGRRDQLGDLHGELGQPPHRVLRQGGGQRACLPGPQPLSGEPNPIKPVKVAR